MDRNVEKEIHEDATSSQTAHKLSQEAQHHKEGGVSSMTGVTPKPTSAENLADTIRAFADVDELESRRIPGTAAFRCEGSHSNGYDAGVRWGGCLSDRTTYDELYPITGDRGSSVKRSLQQSNSDVKNDTWTKKEIVFGENGKDAIASRLTHKGLNNELSSSLNFESLGHLYTAATIGSKTEIRRLPDNADVTNPELNIRGKVLTDEKSIEYRAAENKANRIADSLEFLHIKDPVDNKTAVDDIAKKLDAGLTRQAAAELESQLLSVQQNLPADAQMHDVINAQNEILKDLADKTANGHGATLHINGDLYDLVNDVRIEPPSSGEAKNSPRFMVLGQSDGTSDFIAAKTKINEQTLIKLDPRLTDGMIPGMVIQLP